MVIKQIKQHIIAYLTAKEDNNFGENIDKKEKKKAHNGFKL